MGASLHRTSVGRSYCGQVAELATPLTSAFVGTWLGTISRHAAGRCAALLARGLTEPASAGPAMPITSDPAKANPKTNLRILFTSL